MFGTNRGPSGRLVPHAKNARIREGGGAGLGLAIVRTCVEACQGTVRCRNRTPSGLEVEMRLKTAAVPDTISAMKRVAVGRFDHRNPDS